ncbi:hypothetical protein [Ferrovibrio terrae]|uniref:hypothetical protein n=1 Tax=Ferrovibrio terrae TaxID=2594003 RepID=UPI0031377A12
MSDETFPRCEPHQASFHLVAKVDGPTGPQRLAVEPNELLAWVITAAQFDGRFHRQLQQQLAALPITEPRS